MKVTKLIREYVEEQVGKVYNAKVNPYSEQAELDRQKLKDFMETIREQQQEFINKFLLENPAINTWDNRPYVKSAETLHFSNWGTQATVNEKKWEQENKRQKDAKIREIMLSLELGANRQELNDMIAKLMEE